MPQLEFSIWIINLSINWSIFTLIYVSLNFSNFYNINLINTSLLNSNNLLTNWNWN